MSLEGKTEEEINALEKELLRAVESNSGKAGNVTLIRLLNWEEDLYWSVRDRLVDAGLLELGRGKGGSVRRILPVAPEPPTLPTVEPQPPAPSEAQLYEPVARMLKERWVKDNRFRESLVEITAKQGKRDTGGKWTRPDITVVGMTTYVYVPGKHFDVTTFEVKGADFIDVTAVYEALAHRRAATRAYVIVYVPTDKPSSAVENLLDEVGEEAKRHGVGLIVMENLEDYGTWDIRVEAVRTEPAPERLNEFIAIQLSDGAKQLIVQWFR
jgi:hypothetical protein